MMRKSVLYIVLLLLCLNSTWAYAELFSPSLPHRKGFRVGMGNTVVHSAFTVEEQFDSNVFLTPSDRKLDVITLLNPSAGVEIPFLRDSNLSFDYDAGINFFGRYKEQNHIDHRFRGLAEINFTDYKITVGDTYRHFTDRSGSENTTRLKQQTNDFQTDISAEFELFGFDVGYKNQIQDYLTEDISYGPLTYEDKSTMTNIFIGSLSYRFKPKTVFILESDLGFIDYYNSSLSPNSYFIDALFGIKGEWFKKINVNLKGGFRYQSYDHSGNIIIGNKDYIGPVIRGGLDYYVTDDDTLKLRLERGVYESTYANMNYYDVNMIGLDYVHNFSDKLSATIGGLYQINLYPSESTENGETAKRYDNIFGLKCGIRYDIREWLSIEGNYEYRQRISRFSNLDYYDHLITGRGTVGF